MAIVDIGFATVAGSRQPAQLQGKPVQPHSVEVIDLATIAARDEAEVAVKVEATFGELVVGRAQVYQGEGRLGYGVGLAAPALRSQWWFANGEKGTGVTERYSSTTRPRTTSRCSRRSSGSAGHGSDRADRRAGTAARHVQLR